MDTVTALAQEGTFRSSGDTAVPAHSSAPAPARIAPSIDDRLHVPDTGSCTAVNDLLSRVGDKWTIRVIGSLGDGPLRFNELRRTIDAISQRMLTRTLRVLERDGLVRRLVEPSVPPKVEYSLTPLGHSLQAPVRALGQWALDNRAAVARSRENYDALAQDG